MAIVFPINPNDNDTFTAANGSTYIYNAAKSLWAVQTTASAAIAASIGDTAPSNPVEGQQWFNTSTLKTYVYYDGQWLISNPIGLQGPPGQDGADGADGISDDPNTLSLYQSGTLSITDGTARWYAPANIEINKVTARLVTAATGDTTIVINKNDIAERTISIPSGTFITVDNTPFTLNEGDYFTTDITDAGTTPGEDLYIQMIYSYT